jgi:two-component system response regulator HydG
MQLSPQVAERLLAHDWPGNVRELENCMERIAALSRYDVTVSADLPSSLLGTTDAQPSSGHALPDNLVNLAELERQHILRVVKQLDGNKSRAAQLLGLDRRTLYRKLDLYRKQQSEEATPAPSVQIEALAAP